MCSLVTPLQPSTKPKAGVRQREPSPNIFPKVSCELVCTMVATTEGTTPQNPVASNRGVSQNTGATCGFFYTPDGIGKFLKMVDPLLVVGEKPTGDQLCWAPNQTTPLWACPLLRIPYLWLSRESKRNIYVGLQILTEPYPHNPPWW